MNSDGVHIRTTTATIMTVASVTMVALGMTTLERHVWVGASTGDLKIIDVNETNFELEGRLGAGRGKFTSRGIDIPKSLVPEG
jgi:hypothetical protein